MNPQDESANRVWETTLPQIRDTRRRRRQRRVILAAMPVLLLLGASWLALEPHPTVRGNVVSVPPMPELPETIAVMRVDEEGRVRLEELPASEFGSVELAFGLTQLVSDDLPD